MTEPAALAGFTRFDFTDPEGRWTRPVWRRGTGPAVIVIHEMPGLHPLVISFAERVADAGMTVFCPSLFGEAGRPVTPFHSLGVMLKAICISREFAVWSAEKSSPIVDWLRALARRAHEECGGKGVGAVGMCFTGGFALAMMTEPSVVAPVLSQPSLPLPIKMGSSVARRRAGFDMSPEELSCAKARLEKEDLTVMGLRFHGDGFVPDERFETLKAEFGDRFEAIELDPKDAKQGTGAPPHSVLTIHLDDGDPDGPTKKVEQRVIAFFKERTGA